MPGYLILFFTTFPICENGYIPSYHYFFRYRWKHTYQERLELSNQCENYEYTRIGEGVFTREYLIFYDFGAILHYSEIKKISFSKVRNLNVVTAYLKNGKKYSFNITQAEYEGDSSSYQMAIDRFKKFDSSQDVSWYQKQTTALF